MKYLFIFIISIKIFALSSEEILKKTEALTEYDNMYSLSTMTIENKGKITSSMTSSNYFKKVEDENWQLIKYTSPARLKNTAILSKGNNIWYYNKRTNRLRLLSTSAKEGSMMGSSFSYDDMTLDYIKDFKSKLIEEKNSEYKIKLTPIENKKFKYIIAYINSETFLESKIEYYNQNEIKYKELLLSEYIKIDEKQYPLKLIMNDILESKLSIIESDYSTIDTTSQIPVEVFSEMELKRQ
jgi:hypothetical protein